MALYTTFGELQTMLRAECRLSTNPAVGVSANDRYKTLLNRVYASLAAEGRWTHLRYTAPRILLQPGERFYDPPTAIDFDSMVSVTYWRGATGVPLDPGIGAPEYAAFNAGVQSEPALRYDLRATGPTAVQMEIWPTPNGPGNEIEISGWRKTPKLVNAADMCLLDDYMVVLFAATEVLRPLNKDDADAKLRAALGLKAQLMSDAVLPQGAGETAPAVGTGTPMVGLRNGRATLSVRRV